MPPADFFSFLDASLGCVAADEPQAFSALMSTMSGMKARLISDGEGRTLRFDPPQWTISADHDDPDIEVGFERATVLAFLDGAVTLKDALSQEQLRLRGPVTKIERFHEGLLIYLEGLMRSHSVRPLLDRYRSAD